jgi:serine/threonine protein kinase
VQQAHDVDHSRDLKPGNVLFVADGLPKTDFGLAKRVEGDNGLTQTAAIVGTPSHGAPSKPAATNRRLARLLMSMLGAILTSACFSRDAARHRAASRTTSRWLRVN